MSKAQLDKTGALVVPRCNVELVNILCFILLFLGFYCVHFFVLRHQRVLQSLRVLLVTMGIGHDIRMIKLDKTGELNENE